MIMDIDVSRWILEFVLRSSTSNFRPLKEMLAVLPISDDDLSLKKTLLLRHIEDDVTDGLVEEKHLGMLEMIEELDKEEEIKVIGSMQAAYCAIAVDCTVRYLEINSEKKFIDAVERIWRKRMRKLENWGKSGLVSEELKSWRTELEAAISDSDLRKKLVTMNNRNEAARLVGEYLEESWTLMGPPFLELAQELAGGLLFNPPIVKAGEGEKNTASVDEEVGTELPNEIVHQKAGEELTAQPVSDTEMPDLVENQEVDEVVDPPIVKAGEGEKNAASVDEEVGAELPSEIVDQKAGEELTAQSVNDTEMPDLVENQEVDEGVERGVCSSDTNLNSDTTASKDNEALESEATVKVNDANAVGPSHNQNDIVERAATENQCDIQKNDVPRPSLMEHNETAIAFEWSDSIDNLPEGGLNPKSKLLLKRPKSKVTSPLKNPASPKVNQRRPIRRWTSDEEDTLRNAVKKYGQGNWKLILSAHRGVFEERTEVDLKDKWRNMIR